MRIISGIFKGKKIALPVDKNTRPLRDLVKESIFNLINHSKQFDLNIFNSEILDLFSGSGSFGLECISRGAKKVIFIENYKPALEILKRNIVTLKSENKSDIIEKDCFKIFEQNIIFSKKFDLIFMDPPYKEENINFLIDQIKHSEILKKNGVLIIHRHKKDTIKITKKLNILIDRNYGISKIIIGN
jgi:16S rRNA (guanine966-N2)-methyltransferase